MWRKQNLVIHTLQIPVEVRAFCAEWLLNGFMILFSFFSIVAGKIVVESSLAD